MEHMRGRSGALKKDGLSLAHLEVHRGSWPEWYSPSPFLTRRPSGVFRGRRAGAPPPGHKQYHLPLIKEAIWSRKKRYHFCSPRRTASWTSPVVYFAATRVSKDVSALERKASDTLKAEQQQQQQQQKPVCTIIVTPLSSHGNPTMMGPPHSQVHNYFSFLTLPPSRPPQPSEREGGPQSVDVQTPSRLGHNAYTGVRNGREAGVVAPGAPAGGGGTNTGALWRSPSGRKSRPGVLNSEVANRRVRFWRSRTPTPQPQAVGSPRVTTPAVGIPSSLPPTSLGRPQRPLGPSLAAAALGGRPLPAPKRGGGPERGPCRVTFAPPGPRAPISARRAFSTCPPLSTVKVTGDKLAAAEAPETPTVSTASTAGLPLGTTSPQQLPINNLQGPPPEEATTMNPMLAPTGKTTQQQQQLLLQQQDVERGEALPPPDPLPSGVRQGTPLLLDDTVDPLAADGVSLAATRAAAVAKAAAAVAAAAQAEVEAVAAVAAWGERGAYKGGNSSLAAEQRKEQLMLVLRLLLLLPPELQHAIQARLFMLQQRRSGSGAAHPGAKRAATAANLHMTFGASGTIGVPSRPQQQQHPAAAAAAAAAAFSPRPPRPNPNELPENSSSSSSTKTADSLQQQQEKQQQQHQHQHLQHSGADSTVNGLFLSATLQASAVLQLTPGGPLDERTILATPTPLAAAEGGSASHLPAGCRLASCRCRSSAGSVLPYRAQPSFAHGRSSLLLQQQQHQQQQHVHLPRRQPQDYTGGGPLGSQQQHQEAQPHAEGGFLGRNSLGAPQASCCLLRRSVGSQKGEALWMVETPGGSQGPPGPSSWVGGACRRCAGAAAASSGSFCSSSCSRGGQAREQPSCLQQHGVAGGPRPHGGASQLHFYGSTSSHLSTTNTGRSLPASGATECCHSLHKGPCSKGPPSAAHQQQQQVTEEEKAGWVSGEGGLGGCARQKLNWGEGSLSPSAVELRMPMGCRGQQQGPRQAVTVHPSQMVGLRMRPCGSCCNSSSSMSCGNQGLLQVHLSSIPSIMRTDPMMGACSTATDLGSLPDSRSSRLLVVARSRSGAPMALALSPNRGSNSTVSSGTDSSNTATSNSLSDASRNKEAPLETPQLDGEEATLREREESLLPGEPAKTQQGAAAQAAVAATIAAATLGRRSWSQRAEAEEGCEQPLQILRSRVLECPPATPEREHCCSAECCSSPTLTVGRSSSRGDLDDPICDLDDRTGEIDDPLCDLDEPTGSLDEPMEDDVGDPTGDLEDCKSHLRPPPACPWVIRSSPSIETLSASLASGFVPLPEAEAISSGKSINGPTSIFSGSDPRGYGGSLVKSAVFSVETLPTTVVLPSRRGCPAALSLGGPQGLRNQQQNAPLSMLAMERCCHQSYPAFRLQDQQQHPSSCPNLPLRDPSPAEKLLGSRVVCGMVSGSNEAPRLLESTDRAGNLWSHGCSQGTSCLPERSPHSLVPPKKGKPMRFAEEPLHCSPPPEAVSTPESSCPVATPPNTAFSRCLPPGRQGSQMETSGGGLGRGLYGDTMQKGTFVGAHGGGILDVAGDLDMPPNCRRLPFVYQQSAAMPPTEEVAPVEDGSVGKTKAEGLEGPWVPSEKLRVPDGVDWRSSEIASAVNACISQLHSLHSSQCPPFTRELLLNALQAVPGECLAESRKAAAFLTALATSRKDGNCLSSSKTKKGSQSVSAEDTEAELFSQPFELFAFAGLDMEHAIPDGPSYVLHAAAEAQKDLALRHQREMDDLEASAARLGGDTSGVLALYAHALHRVCHSALQRSLKASRAVASLQLADEERVHLLLRFQSELTRLCTETKTFQLHCSTDNKGANGSACERPPKQSTVSLTVEPVSPEMSRAAAPSKNIGGPSGLNSAEGDICLPCVPELLLLHDAGGVRKRFASLCPMREAAREESWANCNSLRLAPHVFEKQEQSVAAPQLWRTFPSQVQLTGSALENFVSNQQIVSSFLNKFASWQFDATLNFKSEESFLRRLQEEFADVTLNGVQVPLSKFVLQWREAAFRSLPREMASAEHMRELLQPVAKYFSESLPSPEVLLQQQVKTSIELLLGAPPAPLDVSKPCMPEYVAIWLEALMSCLSSRTGVPVCPHRLLPWGTPSTGSPMNRQGQPTLAVPQVGKKDIWNENIQHVETELGLKLEQLRKECLNSLSEAAQTLESVMQVKVVRLPTAS